MPPRWVVPAAAAVVVALLASNVARALSLGIADEALAFFTPAACLGVAVALAFGRWPERRRMALVMLAWLLVGVVDDLDWVWRQSRLAATLSVLAFGLGSVVYGHMVLAYPIGVVRDRWERALLRFAYPAVLAWAAFPLLFNDAHDCRGDCLPQVPSLIYTGHPLDLSFVGHAFDALLLALGIATLLLLRRRLRREPRGALRTQLPLLVAATYAAVQFVVHRAAVLAGVTELDALNWVDRLNTQLIPLAILIGIATIRRERGPVGDLVVALASARPGEVRSELARTLGDPTLELALWLPERRRYVDEGGTELPPPVAVPGRAVTLVGPEGEPLAALIHDEALLDQRPLLEALGSAARLALENTRLQAQLRAQLEELRASRSRIVAAADSERRRLERDLHDGAQQRLLAVGLALQLLGTSECDPQLLAQAQEELQAALGELRDLARGIHPAILTEQGLGAAVRSLVDRVPLTIALDVVDERCDPAAEAAAYFVVSEALVNVAKHAQATTARVSATITDGRLVVEVSDEGNGGAAAASGGGLQGLTDRVGTVGGELEVRSAPGAGTTIRAEIPCVSS